MEKIINEDQVFSRINRWRIGRKKICATIFCDDQTFLKQICRKLIVKLNNDRHENESEWILDKIYFDETERVNKAIVRHADVDMEQPRGKFEISVALWHG